MHQLIKNQQIWFHQYRKYDTISCFDLVITTTGGNKLFSLYGLTVPGCVESKNMLTLPG